MILSIMSTGVLSAGVSLCSPWLEWKLPLYEQDKVEKLESYFHRIVAGVEFPVYDWDWV